MTSVLLEPSKGRLAALALLGAEKEFNHIRGAFSLVWGALTLLVTLGPSAHAELPPSAYPDPQMASEALDIKVLSSKKWVTENNANLTRWDVEVVANVRAVRKTGTGLREGDRILICYRAHRYKKATWVGRGSQPILAKGDTWSAFLNVDFGEQNDRYYKLGGAPYSTFRLAEKK